MKKYFILAICFLAILSSCIKDDVIEDYVESTIRIRTILDSIALNTSYQFEYMYLNNVGIEENVQAIWSSADPSIIEITDSGLATAKALGNTDISIEYQESDINVKKTINVHVGFSTVELKTEKSGTIQTTSSYQLEGSFTLIEEGNNLTLNLLDDYKASEALPGLYVYLSNNANTTANALEISAVETFSGAHSYTIEGVDINDYSILLYFCKPFNQKVGDGQIE